MADEGLLIFDVSNPAQPVQLGSLTRLGPVFGVAIDRDDLYCDAGWDSDLHYLARNEIGDPHMKIIHLTQPPLYDFVVDDSITYAVNDSGLLIIDMSVPLIATVWQHPVMRAIC